MFSYQVSRIVAATAIAAALFVPRLAAANGQPVFINEIQTGTSSSASQEFVELYNASSDSVDLSGWSLQYRAASGTGSWYKKADLSGSIAVGGFYLLATNGYLQPDQVMSSGLAASGGSLRLVDSSGQTADLVGWGTAATVETAAAPAPPANQSLERVTTADTNDNSVDFIINPYPDPTATDGVSQGTPPPDPSSGSQSDSAGPAVVSITELLVNPAGSDATDEFIELFNASPSPADLSGYKLQAGSGFKSSYTLPSGTTIGAGQYLAFYSRQTHVTLTNTSGAARLVDAGGGVVDQTADYDSAPAGQSWALFDDGWQWTADVTPGGANILLVPPPPVVSSATKTATTKAKATKAAATSTKTAKTKAAKSTKAAKTTTANSALLAAATDSPQSHWLLIAALALTIGYAIYEFRYDLRNYYVLAKRKLGLGRKDRPAA